MLGEQLLFWIFAATAVLGAAGVVLSQSVIRMAISLIASLASVSCLFFLLNADFVGAVQLMVYVGGTLVLLIFGIMLTSGSPATRLKTSPGEVFLAAAVALAFSALIGASISAVTWPEAPASAQAHNAAQDGNTLRPLALAFTGLRPDAPTRPGYLLPFEIVSMHLLVVLAGSAYLARTRTRPQSNPTSPQ